MTETNEIGDDGIIARINLEDHVTIPPQLNDFINRRGPLPAANNDLRRHRRFYYPLAAAAEFRETLMERQQDPGQFVVVIRDISRSGLAFYHVEQICPGEQLQICLTNGPKIVTVVRCTRRAEGCYEIGATYA